MLRKVGNQHYHIDRQYYKTIEYETNIVQDNPHMHQRKVVKPVKVILHKI